MSGDDKTWAARLWARLKSFWQGGDCEAETVGQWPGNPTVRLRIVCNRPAAHIFGRHRFEVKW